MSVGLAGRTAGFGLSGAAHETTHVELADPLWRRAGIRGLDGRSDRRSSAGSTHIFSYYDTVGLDSRETTD